MKKHFLVTLAVSAFLFSGNVIGQKTWTLQECISYAYENNINLKRQTLNTELSKSNYLQSKVNLAPSLNGQADYSFGSGKNLNQSDYSWVDAKTQTGNVGLYSELTLFNGLSNFYSIKSNEFNMQKTLQDLEKAKNDLAMNIAVAYLQILYNEELKDIAKNQVDISIAQVEKSKKLYEVGNIAKGSLLEIQAQVAAERVNLTNAENQLNISYLSLTQLLDLDSTQGFTIAKNVNIDVDSLALPLSFGEVYSTAESSMPEIKSAQYKLEAARTQLSSIKGQRYPSLVLNGSYSSWFNQIVKSPLSPTTGNISYNDQLKNQAKLGIGLTLRVPIFNKFSTQNTINSYKLNMLDAQYAFEYSKQVLYKEIQQAYADALAAYQNHKARTEAVTASEESFKYVQQKFDVGMVNSVDYNIAKNNYTKAKSDLLQAKYQFIFKIKILDFYKGKPINI
jgi:outer membrane protein